MNIFEWYSNLQKDRTSYKKVFVFISGFFLSFIPITAFAHVKWFVKSEGGHTGAHFHADPVSLLLVFGFLLFLFFCYWLNVRASKENAVHSLLYTSSSKSDLAWSALKFAVAVLFTANIIQNNFIAPNFIASPSHFQIAIQGALLIALILNADLFAALLIFFAAMSLIIYPVDSAMDYAIELIALAQAIYFLNPIRIRKFYNIQFGRVQLSAYGGQIGLMLLRFGLGLQLIILTLHDKFFHPGLALEFLEMHPEFNFVRLFGLENFSDIHFVLAAGLAELAFGVVLVANMSARVGLMLILFFFVTTGIVLGVEELVGHVPIVIAALVLFLFPSRKPFQLAIHSRNWQAKQHSSDVP